MCPTSQQIVVRIWRTNQYHWFVPTDANDCLRRQANTDTIKSKNIFVLSRNYNFLWTLLGTLAATVTLGIINSCQIIFHCDGTGFTLLDTNRTADTAGLAGNTYILALVLRVAGHCLWCLVRNKLDESLWTSADTLTASYTLFLIYHCNAVYHVNGIKGTGLYAGAVA